MSVWRIMREKFKRLQLVILLLFLSGKMALSCQVPVFRYALERWTPDPYTVKIIPAKADGTLTSAEQDAFDFLTKTQGNADFMPNFLVDVVNPKSDGTQGARLEVYAPQRIRSVPAKPIWEGPFNLENARKLVDSPARRELVKRILSGDSVVWVFMPSGNPRTR